MKIEAVGRPIRYRFAGGEIRLDPGRPIDLPDDRARKLLAKAPGKVRIVPAADPTDFCPSCGGGYWIRVHRASAWQCGRCHPSEVQVDTLYIAGGTPPKPSAPATTDAPAPVTVEPAQNPCPAYWEGADGVIRAGTVTLLGRTGTGLSAEYWLGIETPDGAFRWVREDRLRSRAQYDAQAAPIKPGWQIVYRRNTKLHDAIVQRAELTPTGWVFATEDGTAIHESAVLSVAQIENTRVVAAWTVKDHGLDGRSEDPRRYESKQKGVKDEAP